jgi:hypothetical protein
MGHRIAISSSVTIQFRQQRLNASEDKATVNRICCEFADLQKCNKSDKAAAEHATDFALQRP